MAASEAFQKMSGAARNHEVSLINGIVVVFTFSGEEIFRKVAFACPCSQPSSHLYGGSFIWGPAIVLFVFGLLINNVTWRLAHGCLHRSKKTRHGPIRGCKYVVAIIGRALVAPSAWIFVSLLDGGYYMCMVSKFPCATNSTTNKLLVAQSQTMAWIYLVTVCVIILTVLCATRCVDKFTYVQSKYIESYQELELTKFDEVMRDRAGRLAEKNVAEFFDKDIRMKEDWDAISVAPVCDVHWVKKPQSLMERFNIGGNFPEPFFSPLHKWANESRTDRVLSDEDQMEIIGLQMAPGMPPSMSPPILPTTYNLPPENLPPAEFWYAPPPNKDTNSKNGVNEPMLTNNLHYSRLSGSSIAYMDQDPSGVSELNQNRR